MAGKKVEPATDCAENKFKSISCLLYTSHVYKDIETRDLLKLIPIEDVIEYHGIYNLIFVFHSFINSICHSQIINLRVSS